MLSYLECTDCGAIYNEKADVDFARKGADGWAKLCRADGVESRGLNPCPNISCKGELVLVEK